MSRRVPSTPRRMSRRVPEGINGQPRNNSKNGGRKRESSIIAWSYMRFSPARSLKYLQSTVVTALRFVSGFHRTSSSHKGSSDGLGRLRPYVERYDSQRAEAIEDCIAFLNSSSSAQISDSVSVSS